MMIYIPISLLFTLLLTYSVVNNAMEITVQTIEELQKDLAQIQKNRSQFNKRRNKLSTEEITSTLANNAFGFPLISDSFIANGQTYTYRLIGKPPASKTTTKVDTWLIPLKININLNGKRTGFEAMDAVKKFADSPIYKSVTWTSADNMVGQYVDVAQRITLWNKMDKNRSWHLIFNKPSMRKQVGLNVPDNMVTKVTYVPGVAKPLVAIDIEYLDAQIRSLIQTLKVPKNVFPIFVTQDVITNYAFGYHDVMQRGSDLLSFTYTTWLDINKVGPLYADISTATHEVLEWINDPLVDNIVPYWQAPPVEDPRSVCGDNNFLEVGDPQGNYETADNFPTYVVPLNGFNYHIQQCVLVPWFTGKAPSNAYKGWYSFPDPTSITTPAQFCTPSTV